MSLNIKNEVVHDLVRRAAARTGKSQTSVVEAALRAYLDDLDRAGGSDTIDDIVARLQRTWRDSTQPAFGAEDLYDPHTGLPA